MTGRDVETEKFNILIVDDQEDGLLALKTTLEPLGQNIVTASSGREALRLLLRQDFALVLLDVVMPVMDGFETAQLIRSRDRSRYTPIIFLTALSGGELPLLKAYEMGAVDYLVKPYIPSVVRSKVAVFIELARKTELARNHEQALREAQQREHERELAEAFRVAEVERVRIRAEELQRALQMRDDFLSVASHELRTPLTAIKLSLHATKSRLDNMGTGQDKEAVQLKERFKLIDRSVDKLAGLVEQLLDVSRLTTGTLKPQVAEMDLSRLTEEVLARFQDEFMRAGCDLKVSLEPEVVGMWDAFRLDQVVTNLVSNALKYARGKPIEVVVRRVGSEAELVVRDEGLGIPPEHHERIFERFERAVDHSSISGFGLGLWIVRQIINAMEGTVAVASTPGAGAEFTVRLRLGMEAQDAQRAAG